MDILIILIPFAIILSQLIVLKDICVLEDNQQQINKNLKTLNNNLKRLSEDIKYREEVLNGALNNNLKEFLIKDDHLIESVKKDLKNKNNVKS